MAFRPNVPFDTGSGPFPKFALRWGTTPTQPRQIPADEQPTAIIPIAPGVGVPLVAVPANGGPVSGGSLGQVNFGARVSGLAGIYPKANRVASQQFVNAIGLLAASLSSSIVNTTSDSVMVVVIARDVGAAINLQASTDILVEHICEQGISFSFRSGIGFAQEVAPQFSSNQNIAIYVASSGTGVAGNRVTAIATIRYFSLP